MAGGPPTGTLTFLFTDIEGSTQLWERHPTHMRVALRRHDHILRSAIDAHRGFVFSTAGDAFCAAFERADDAFDAALTAQDQLSGADWPDESRIRVRMGLHTGVADERDGDYFGPVLNRTARLMSIGHGGQILVSSTTRARLGGRKFVDLGEHRLKDLGAAEHVWQAGRTEFPPLRTNSVTPPMPSLPIPASRFFGRDEDLERLGRLVRETRVVTVSGPGGVGKTRTALEVASRAGVDFVDGLRVVELASVGEADQVSDAVASSLGVTPQPGATTTESIVTWLAPRKLLLVIDNCEHVLDAAADLVDAVVRGTSGVNVLATSREALTVEGEHRWPLEPLADDAIAMFLDRARAVAPGTDLAAHADLVREVCRRVDRLPLAIELAAARLSTLSIEEIAAGLDDPLEVLTGRRRRGAERHRSLRSVVEWSHRQLDSTAAVAFERLAVFAAAFSVDEAAAVTSIDDIGVHIEDLVERSLLVARQGDDRTRYDFMETIRSFARERLEHSGEAQRLRDAHAGWTITRVAAESGRLLGPDELRAHHRLTALVPEMRAAHRHLLGRTEPDGAYRLCAPLHVWALTRSHGEAFGWADSSIARFGGSGHRLEPAVLSSAAVGAWQRGDLRRAGMLVERAREASVEASALGVHESGADVALLQGRLDDARELSIRAGELAQTAGNDGHASLYFGNAALACAYAGEHDQAVTQLARARPLAARLAAPSLLAWLDYCEGESIVATDPDRAILLLEQARDTAEEVGARFIAGVATLTWVTNRARIGEPEDALPQLAELLEHWRRTGTWLQLWTTLRALVEVLAALDELEGAAVLIGAMEASVTAAPLFGGDADRIAAARDRIVAELPDHGAAATRIGRRLSDDEAMSWALERVDTLTQRD